MARRDLQGERVMRLALCSSAAPEASLAGLVQACGRRGLDALELREGDGHGVNPDHEAITGAVGGGRAAAGVEIVGYRSLLAGHDLWLARLSEALDAPVLLDGSSSLHARLVRGRQIADLAGRVSIVVTGEEYLEAGARAAGAGFDVAWDVDPLLDDVGAQAAQLLDRVGDRLRHVRLLGGGPEAAAQEGRGIGAAMARLALSGYAGTLSIAPSSSRYRLAWSAWLGRRGGWGCGSRADDETLVQLSSTITPGGV